MFTRCPNCDATQAVTVGQLRQQRGLLTCDICGQRFDGLADLSDDASQARVRANNLTKTVAKPEWPGFSVWKSASVVAFVTLLGQVFYFESENLYRSSAVAAAWQRLCGMVACQPPIYKSDRELSVSHTDLQRQSDNSYLFSAAITNHADFSQEGTVLRLTLLGFNGQAIAERAFSLQQLAGVAVLKPDQTLPIRLHIAAPGAQVGGYVFKLS